MLAEHDRIRPIIWRDHGLELLDQRHLPAQAEYLRYTQAPAVADAIRAMVVRGAPAIGITAAYGVALAARAAYGSTPHGWRALVAQDLATLAASRPTAVNLFWALQRMQTRLTELPDAPDPYPALLAEAQAIHAEDIAANQRMGQLGAQLLTDAGAVLTHCNTGSLATGGFGTALGVIRAAYSAGHITQVYADETRPWLQGARLTAWELVQDQIPVTLIAEGAAAWLLRQGQVRWILVGADRITANGDVANKIGTYSLALLARQHGVRFMVVAPTSTIDMQLTDGSAIPIEQRSAEEVLSLNGQRVAASGAQAWNPAFDVTPAEFVDALVTERGVVLAPDLHKMRALMESAL